MPPRKSANHPTDLSVALQAEATDEAPPTPEQLLAQFFGEAQGDDIVCSVYEVSPTDHRDISYLFTFPLTANLLAHELYEDLLLKYGAGRYEIQAKRRNGQFVKRIPFQIGTERERKRALIPERQKQDDAPRPGAAAPGDVSPALAALLEGQQRMFERLLERDAPRDRDRLSDLREMIEIQKLLTPPSPAATPLSEAFGLVKDVLKLKDELSDQDGDGGSPLVNALKQFAPAITRAVDKLAGPGSRPTAPAPAAGTGAAPPAPAKRNGNSEGFTMNFDGVFAELAAHAEKGSAPPEVADAILEWLADRPAWIEQAVLGMIVEEEERVVNRIVGSYPKLEPRREWLVEVVRALLAKLDEAAASDAATPPDAKVASVEGTSGG